jgi:hypothetical protein
MWSTLTAQDEEFAKHGGEGPNFLVRALNAETQHIDHEVLGPMAVQGDRSCDGLRG